MRSFSGAKAKCMCSPTIRGNPNHIVIHVSKYNIPSQKLSVAISSKIVDLALKLKSETCQISISNLATRNGQYCRKALKLNKHLKVMCRKNNVNIIDYRNTRYLYEEYK